MKNPGETAAAAIPTLGTAMDDQVLMIIRISRFQFLDSVYTVSCIFV